MQRLKLIVLAVMAALSLGALLAGAASGVIPATLLPETEEVKGTGTSGPGTLTVLGGTTIVCSSATAEGSVAAGAKLGPFTQDIKGCKEQATGATCTGLGEAAGVILVSGEAHGVVDVETPALGAGDLLLVTLVHFTCSIVLVEVKGEELCLVKPVATKTTHFEGICEETAVGSGDPKETKYWNEKGEEVNISLSTGGLLVSISHGAFKGAARSAAALGLTNKEVTIDA
jgi:hypothetical protein